MRRCLLRQLQCQIFRYISSSQLLATITYNNRTFLRVALQNTIRNSPLFIIFTSRIRWQYPFEQQGFKSPNASTEMAMQNRSRLAVIATSWHRSHIGNIRNENAIFTSIFRYYGPTLKHRCSGLAGPARA